MYFRCNKKIIFFDGDGTLWYPKSTKRKKAPHWIYSDKKIGDDHLGHLVLTPGALISLKKLKELRIALVLLSTHPHPRKEADAILKRKVEHFKLWALFDDIYTSRDNPEGKGEVILKILRKRRIPKSQALMVGDSYRFDYLSAKKIGVDALLIKSEYMKHPPRGRKIEKTIGGLKDVVEIMSAQNYS